MVSSAAAEARWSGGSHPLIGGVQTMIATLDEMTTALAAGSDPSWLPAAEQGYYLASLQQITDRATTMKQAALAALDAAHQAGDPEGPAASTGARSTADWLAHRTCANPRRLAAEAKLGARTATRIHLTAAMLDGLVSPEHARVITECLDALPTDLLARDDMSAEELMEAVELQLIEYCRQFSPAEVARLARHVLDVVDPERAEQIEAERLARAEREAWRRTKLTTRGIGEGFVRVSADIPALHASILDTVLNALTHPRTATSTASSASSTDGARPDGAKSDGEKPDDGKPGEAAPDDGQYLSGAQRRGQAFCTLLENLDTTTLPQRHGTAVAVTVVVDEDRLRREVNENGLATTTTGVDLSLEQARRLMCGAGVWPAVMGGASVVLDAGRTRRFFDGKIRAALEIAHPTCQATGCTIPAAWCDGHHRTPWAAGGTTRVTDGALLCPHHHRRVHDTRYDTHWTASGEATFHRRQ